MKETLTRAWRRFCQDESGASAVEYGLLTALIAAVIVGVVGTLGTTIQMVSQAPGRAGRSLPAHDRA